MYIDRTQACTVLYCKCTVCFSRPIHCTLCVLSDHDLSLSPLCRGTVLTGTAPTCGQQTLLHSIVMTSPLIWAPYLSAVAPPTQPHPPRRPHSQPRPMTSLRTWSLSNADSSTLLSWTNRNLNPHKARLSKASDLLQRFWTMNFGYRFQLNLISIKLSAVSSSISILASDYLASYLVYYCYRVATSRSFSCHFESCMCLVASWWHYCVWALYELTI